LLNILGLATGMATVLLIVLYVADELSYDKFHANARDLYRAVENQYYAGQDVFPVAVTPHALAASLKDSYPEIEQAARANFVWSSFDYKEQKVEDGGIFVDDDFLTMFSFELKQGDKATALKDISSIVITEELATKLFGKEDAIGKTIRINREESIVVTGVLYNIPENSHLEFSFIMPMEFRLGHIDQKMRTDWDNNTLYTYVKLKSGSSVERINEKIKGHIEKNRPGGNLDLYLQPVTDIHLGEVSFVADISDRGNKQYVQIFTIVAAFILIIACINFMNLSTARAMKRAKEVGLRKAIGAYRLQLIFQFLSESVFTAFIAMAIAILIVDLLLNPFNTLTNKNLSLNLSTLHGMIPVSIVATLFTGLLAGSYPAIFLSSFQPAKVLKGTISGVASGSSFRQILVVLQFSISIVMITATLVVYTQIQFIKNKKLGYEKDNVVNIQRRSNQYQAFKDQLLTYPDIKGVAGTNQHPAYVMNSSAGYSWSGKSPDESILLHSQGIDYDYIETMKMKVVAGRSFSKSIPSDTMAIMINEQAMKIMNLPNVIGEKIKEDNREWTIIGVVEDFHFKSIHDEIEPLLLYVEDEDGFSSTMVHVEGNAEQMVKTIEKEWKKLNSDRPFVYTFLNEDFNNLYRSETQTGTIFQYFAVLAILISSLGLFGLASFTVDQKSKEFGIRKIFGASTSKLFYIASRDFIFLVLIACFISLPVAWFWMEGWLDTFAYHVDLSWKVFIVAGILSIVIAVLTVTWQSIKVALINPAQTLRNE
jgi:ABC-type antimicrobial peptide transport system permease subunit